MKSAYAMHSALISLMKGRGQQAEIARNAVGSLFLKGVYTALSFAVVVILARLLGAEGYGIYAYAYALVSLLSVPAEFGLPNLVLRETAAALAKREWGLMAGVWHWAGRTTGTLALALALIAGGFVWVRGERISGEQLATFAWGLTLVPLVALGNLRGAALRGLHKVIQGQLPEQVLQPGVFIMLVLGGAVLSPMGRLGPSAVMALQALAAALAFAIGARLLVRATPSPAQHASPLYAGRRWLSSTLLLAFTSGMQLINQRTGILMLGLFAAPTDVGLFRVAAQASVLVSFGLGAMNVVVAPQFARLYALGDKARLQRVVTASARAILFFTVPVAAIFLLFGEPLLTLVFGAEFAPAYAPLAILTLGQLVNSAAGSVGFLLNMTGHERDTARGVAIAAMGNIVLNLILIPPLGTNGAALATAITMTAWNLSLWLAVRQRLEINSMAFNPFGNTREVE